MPVDAGQQLCATHSTVIWHATTSWDILDEAILCSHFDFLACTFAWGEARRHRHDAWAHRACARRVCRVAFRLSPSVTFIVVVRLWDGADRPDWRSGAARVCALLRDKTFRWMMLRFGTLHICLLRKCFRNPPMEVTRHVAICLSDFLFRKVVFKWYILPVRWWTLDFNSFWRAWILNLNAHRLAFDSFVCEALIRIGLEYGKITMQHFPDNSSKLVIRLWSSPDRISFWIKVSIALGFGASVTLWWQGSRCFRSRGLWPYVCLFFLRKVVFKWYILPHGWWTLETSILFGEDEFSTERSSGWLPDRFVFVAASYMSIWSVCVIFISSLCVQVEIVSAARAKKARLCHPLCCNSLCSVCVHR